MRHHCNSRHYSTFFNYRGSQPILRHAGVFAAGGFTPADRPPRIAHPVGKHAVTGLYHGSFENRSGEQFVFTFDLATGTGTVSGSDLGWGGLVGHGRVSSGRTGGVGPRTSSWAGPVGGASGPASRTGNRHRALSSGPHEFRQARATASRHSHRPVTVGYGACGRHPPEAAVHPAGGRPVRRVPVKTEVPMDFSTAELVDAQVRPMRSCEVQFGHCGARRASTAPSGP